MEEFRCLHEEEKCSVNSHWMPQYCACHFCRIDYDMIGKVETFQEDFQYLKAEMGVFMDYDSKLEVAEKLNASKNATSWQIVNHFLRLNQTTKNILRDIYKRDFDLFGYNPFAIFE